MISRGNQRNLKTDRLQRHFIHHESDMKSALHSGGDMVEHKLFSRILPLYLIGDAMIECNLFNRILPLFLSGNAMI
jgi:hypothetical protein